MDDQKKETLSIIMGIGDSPAPFMNPRKAAIQRLRAALKSDSDDELESALSDAIEIMGMKDESLE